MGKRPGRVENLQPVRSEKEARERGRAGGIASGEARRAKKTWKEIANTMLEHPTTDNNANALSSVGITKEDATNAAVILYKLIDRCQKGDLEAIKLMAKITGNLEADKLEVSAPVKIVVNDDYGTEEDYGKPFDGENNEEQESND